MRSTFKATLLVGLLISLAALSAPCRAAEIDADSPALEAGAAVKEKPGLGHRLLYYIPNRVLDIVDVFRFRARLGPGLAVNLRGTDYIAFYGGTYNSVFLGLPGARTPEKWRSPFGYERRKGIVFFGVDATDTTPYGPRYSPAEFAMGAQLLIVGLDLGFEPVEFGDVFAGLLLFDPVGDDL